MFIQLNNHAFSLAIFYCGFLFLKFRDLINFSFLRGHIQRMPTETINMFIHLAIWPPVVIDTFFKSELNLIPDCQEIFSDTQILTPE